MLSRRHWLRSKFGSNLGAPVKSKEANDNDKSADSVDFNDQLKPENATK